MNVLRGTNPKLQRLYDSLEDIFGTRSAPIREIKVVDLDGPNMGSGFYRHRFSIEITIDSREPHEAARMTFDHCKIIIPLSPSIDRDSGFGEGAL